MGQVGKEEASWQVSLVGRRQEGAGGRREWGEDKGCDKNGVSRVERKLVHAQGDPAWPPSGSPQRPWASTSWKKGARSPYG